MQDVLEVKIVPRKRKLAGSAPPVYIDVNIVACHREHVQRSSPYAILRHDLYVSFVEAAPDLCVSAPHCTEGTGGWEHWLLIEGLHGGGGGGHQAMVGQATLGVVEIGEYGLKHGPHVHDACCSQ